MRLPQKLLRFESSTLDQIRSLNVIIVPAYLLDELGQLRQRAMERVARHMYFDGTDAEYATFNYYMPPVQPRYRFDCETVQDRWIMNYYMPPDNSEPEDEEYD
jgi:hypothetical protein